MKAKHFLALLALLLLGAACQQQTSTALSTPQPVLTHTLTPAATTTLAVPAITHFPTATPTPTPTTTPSPSPTPTLSPTPAVDVTLGFSRGQRPVMAHVVGQGALKVVIVGAGAALPGQLLAHFRAHPDQAPPEISLWIVPEMNPDGAASGQQVNAAQVDPYRNADTRYDDCTGNIWMADPDGLPEGSGGDFPFSEPESQALRQFLDDAWLVLFYQQMDTPGGVAQISADSCRQYLPSDRLAALLTTTSHYAAAPDYGLSGNWVDYLAGQGIASARIKLPPNRPDNWQSDLEGVQRVLASVDDLLGAAAVDQGAAFTWLDEENVGVWRFAPQTLIHPLALTVLGNTAYLLDSGQVLALDLTAPAPPQALLAPAAAVDQARVLEPLDLATIGRDLVVLDRAGDVYRYAPDVLTWYSDRLDRAIADSSSDYYVALAADATARFLLENSYEYILRYLPDGTESAWHIAEHHDVDVAVYEDAVYLLAQNEGDHAGTLLRYQLSEAEPSLSRTFRPSVLLQRPRQVVATAAAVYVLDQAGYRLLALDPVQGQLQAVFQRRDRQPITSFWADAAGERLILAGQDRLWFYSAPGDAPGGGGSMPSSDVPAGLTRGGRLHDLAFLGQMTGWLIPIGGSDLPVRDLQMPGAPRHYRLGIHEGVDFYWQPGTPVRAAAAGVVIRALVDYVPASAATLDAWRAESQKLGYTSAAALDGYRGRQVWIQHDNGLVTRYAHLSQIAPGIEAGVTVGRGQLIGAVGNSGSPASINNASEDAHLHFEIWLGEQYLGQFLRPVEIREWLERILVNG